MDVEQKLRVVAQKSLCYNCLAQSHGRGNCKSIDRCRRCFQDHNSWLHPMPSNRVWVQMTANVRVIVRPGKEPRITRALIDPNATRYSITLTEAENLNCIIKRGRTTIVVYHCREEQQRIEVECVVEDVDYGFSPICNVEQDGGDCRVNANRNWHKSQEYNLILGADVQNMIFIGAAKGRPGRIYVQDTIFGFTYFGEVIKMD